MEQLQFKVSSAIKDLIGKDLIVDDNIAIFELVKNSYDAYASKVVITFEQDNITIADNGKGMTLSDIEEKWLFLGYSAKKDGSEDKDINKQTSYRDKIKRHFAGAKGIGRFSCDRLGSILKLTTKSELSRTAETIFVDWSQFEVDQASKFTDISIGHQSKADCMDFPRNSTTGTIIEISHLNNGVVWNRVKILKLKHSLEKLINPFSETNDFEIEIVCMQEIANDNIARQNNKVERDLVNGTVKNSISQVLNIKTTQIEAHIHHNEIITTITDRGEKIYSIKETNHKFNKLTESTINLYFLNRAAKNNFTRLMGVEPLNYGSVFLFRNGFRIMPFGNPGDDSWGLDYRSQQGYNRNIGTRDLFGRVDITTDCIDDLKEVSSRDGGLIQTQTSSQLFDFFKVTHRRLERYVAGVLWGEAFLRKKYFHDEKEALEQRKILLDTDKERDKPSYILESSIGSKIDFIQLIKTLTNDKDIEVLYYNKDLANIVSDPMESWNVKPQFISDLEKIAIKTDDTSLLSSIDEAKIRITELHREKEEAEKRAYDSEQRRIEAEEKARKEEARRIEAERLQREESAAREIAQLNAREAELKRREEEILRKEAEQKRKEEQERRKIAESERDVEISKNKYLASTRNITKEAEDIIHTIKISSTAVLAAVKSIGNELSDTNSIIRDELDYILFHIERIHNFSKLLTKADISILSEKTEVDIEKYVVEYLDNYKSTISSIAVDKHFDTPIKRKISLLDLSVILDNLVSNSVKAGASNIHLGFGLDQNKLYMDFTDDGEGVDFDNMSSKSMFEVGITNKRGGSGIGLNTIREMLRTGFIGDIHFVGNGLYYKTGATFRITFR